MDKEFCLLDESWIKVLNDENEIIEVSIQNHNINDVRTN